MSQTDLAANSAVHSTANNSRILLDVNRIRALLPHRYPFLLIDRVIEIENGKRIVALKNVTINEPFFNGHFPTEPVMPGVLIIEALAQAAAVLAYESVIASDPNKQRIVYLAGIDDARFKKMVVPGDQLVLTVEVDRIMRNIGKFKCRATVDGKLATEATLMAALEVG
jgi:3-hydroxyacyl-[acyl-carrier-protein] dehydratase